MELGCCQYIKRCMKCQVYADNIHMAPSDLHNLTSPWPFSMWGLDMISPIKPKAFNGHRFILVAIDYFTKWLEAASYASVTRNVVVKFIKRDIICRYGLPTHIITNIGTNLNNKMMTELYEQFKIKHHNSTPYPPKMNGVVEAANKNIKKIVVTYKDWHDMLPYVLHRYRTSVQTSTGETPYSLVYHMELILLVEVEIPSLRVLAESQLDQLNLIEEKWLTTLCHEQLYQYRIKNAFDKKVSSHRFKDGDLVLRKILLNARDPRGNRLGKARAQTSSQCRYGQAILPSKAQLRKNPKGRPPSLQDGEVSTTLYERKHYQTLAEGIQLKVGPDFETQKSDEIPQETHT
ncbi:Retrovirus-related Pol polyprotein, partial [Mucuna pruriens]